MPEKLIENKLKFGGLIPIDSPTLVARYSDALDRLIGRRTRLERFSIDQCGWSPEIAQELGDDDYLAPTVNQRFILLTPKQRNLPAMRAKFSFAREMLSHFIQANQRELFALTAIDAVCGRFETHLTPNADPATLIDLRTVDINVESARGLLEKARKLEEMLRSLQQPGDLWRDDAFLLEAIDHAKAVGDIERYPLAPHHGLHQRVGGFYTPMHGGLYVFRNLAPDRNRHWQTRTVVVARDPNIEIEKPLVEVIPLQQRGPIIEFLIENMLVHPITKNTADYLEMVMTFLMVERASRHPDLDTNLADLDLGRLNMMLGESRPRRVEQLGNILRDMRERGGNTVSGTFRLDVHQYKSMGDPVAGMLLAELMPDNLLFTFVNHKEVFYRRYETWSEPMRVYAVDFLNRHYLPKREEVRNYLS